MQCPKCLTENPEGAVYCRACGGRIDGKKICPACGGLVEQDDVFCVHCGRRLDGKTVCNKCGAVYEGNFCPSCGNQAATVSEKMKKTGGVDWDKLRRVLGISGSAFAMLGVLCALIFTFLIGVTVTGGGNMGGFEGMLSGESINLYYYFGEAIKDIIDTLDSLTSYEADFAAALLIPAIFGMIIAAVTIFLVVLFSVVATVKFVKFAMGKSEKADDKFAYLAIFSFIVGAVAFKGLHACTISGRDEFYTSVIEMSSGMVFNGATVAGLVLCGIFAGIAAACKIACHGNEIIRRENLIRVVFSVAGIALTAVVIGLSGSVGSRVKFSQDSGYSKFNMLLGDILSLSLGTAFTTSAGSTGIDYSLLVHVICATMSEIFLIVMLVFSVGNMTNNLHNLSPNVNKPVGVAAPFVMACASLLFTIASCFAGNQLYNLYNYSEELNASISFAPAILLTVAAVLNLAVAIAGRVMPTKSKN